MEGPSFPVDVLSEVGIRRQQWAKFVTSCATLPVSALTRLPFDLLKGQRGACVLMDNLVLETCSVANAEGIELDVSERVAFLRDLLERAGGQASMLGDVLSRRRTEIETINGAALELADRHEIDAPFNRAMYALVKGLETSFETGEES
jgi:2-dehydropantoate 2-reductase